MCFLGGRPSIPGGKPRLVRQSAIHDDTQELSSSPPRLGVRFLPTIPSATDSTVQIDEESTIGTVETGTPFYAVIQSGNPLTTLSSPKDETKPP